MSPLDGLNLSLEETQLIINALSAISPSGGGSTQFTLLRKLEAHTHILPDDETVGQLMLRIHEEVHNNFDFEPIKVSE